MPEVRPEDRICYCGCSEDEHDEDTGECLYCVDCEGFSEDVDATLELLEQDGEP